MGGIGDWGASWKRRKPAAENGSAAAAPAPSGEEAAVASLVARLDTLRDVLLRGVADERGVHAETALAAAGALAGRCALEAGLAQAAAATAQDGQVPGDGLVLVGTAAGESFVAGAFVSEHLYGAGDTLARRVAEAVDGLGVPLAELPAAPSLAAEAARMLGSPSFGRFDVPEAHAPHLSPRAAIELLWPQISAVLRAAPSGPTQGMLVDPANWPRQMAIVASRLIGSTAEALDPRVGYVLVMQAALVGAKYHPDLVEPGRWRFETAAGALRVRAGDGAR